METWHVYQLRSDSELLYVGHARRLKIRLDQHRQQKPWWPEVTEVHSEEFATKDSELLACDVECRLAGIEAFYLELEIPGLDGLIGGGC